MAKGKGKQRVVDVVDKENENPNDASVIVRASKFKEGTMNSTNTIIPPPDELWRNLQIDDLIEKFNNEASAPIPAATSAISVPLKTTVASASIAPADKVAVTPEPVADGALGRFSRAVASWFSVPSLSALGKRKAGNENAEKITTNNAADERKKQAEEAYRQAKELGLLPTPKVFVRPVFNANIRPAASLPPSETSTPTPGGLLPSRSPALYKSPSKKDLHKQKKLSKRVSDLEFKLAEARKELNRALGPLNSHPVPQGPETFPPTPKTDSPSRHFFSPSEESPHRHTESPSNPPVSKFGKIVKKRKAAGDSDGEFKPIPTDSDYSLDSEPIIKKTKTTPPKKLKRKSSRLTKNRSNTTKEKVVIVVPDGVAVPPIPNIPPGMPGKRVAVSDDGYGGLEHEMF